MARTTEHIDLSTGDREALEVLLRSPKTAQSLAQRARIVLMCGAGETVESVAASIGISTKAVYKWKNRFTKSGLNGLSDLPSLRSAQEAYRAEDQRGFESDR